MTFLPKNFFYYFPGLPAKLYDARILSLSAVFGRQLKAGKAFNSYATG